MSTIVMVPHDDMQQLMYDMAMLRHDVASFRAWAETAVLVLLFMTTLTVTCLTCKPIGTPPPAVVVEGTIEKV